jgi:hypothetical protein
MADAAARSIFGFLNYPFVFSRLGLGQKKDSESYFLRGEKGIRLLHIYFPPHERKRTKNCACA